MTTSTAITMMSKTDSLGSSKRKHDVIKPPSSSNGITEDGRGSNQAPRSNNEQHQQVRQVQEGYSQQGGYYYALTHQHHTNDAALSNKRRRHEEESQYAAATIQQSLRDAGHHDAHDMSSILQNRRERALPMGSVDMSTVKLVTSAEFDGDMMNDKEEQDDDGEENKEEKTYDSVNSMFMLSSLIQSTRQYYSFSNDESSATASSDAVQASSSSNIIANQPRSTTQSSNSNINNAMTTQAYDHNINDEDISEDTWTPSPPITTNDNGVESSTNDLLNDYLKKNIDNDNRSDGLSSDMADGRSQSSDSVSSCSSVGGTVEVDCRQQHQQEQELHEQTLQKETMKERYDRVVFNGHYSIVG